MTFKNLNTQRNITTINLEKLFTFEMDKLIEVTWLLINYIRLFLNTLLLPHR